MKILRRYKLRFTTSLIFFTFFITKIVFSINFSFSNNVSTEFASIAEYNNFKTELKDTFIDNYKYRSNALTAGITTFPNIIIDEAKKINFGFGFTFYSFPNISNPSELDDFKFNRGHDLHIPVPAIKFNVGFSLNKNLDFYFSTGFSQSSVPIVLTFLWKFYEHKNNRKKIVERVIFTNERRLPELKTTERYSYGIINKLFLQTSIGFGYQKSKNHTYEQGDPYVGNYSFSNNTGEIDITKVKVVERNDFMCTIDLTLKYLLSIKWFNLHVAIGISFNVYKIYEKYQITANVDSYSSGSPTGIDTVIDVECKDKWINFIPHATLGISISVHRRIKIPILVSAMYLPSIKKINFDFTIISIFVAF